MHIGDGGGRDDTESQRLRRVEEHGLALESRVGRLEDAVVRVEASQASQHETLVRVSDTLVAFRAESREDRQWMQALVRDGCQGIGGVLHLLIERATQVHVVAAIALAIAALSAGLYGVAVTYDGSGWRIGGDAPEAVNRVLEDTRAPDIDTAQTWGAGEPGRGGPTH